MGATVYAMPRRNGKATRRRLATSVREWTKSVERALDEYLADPDNETLREELNDATRYLQQTVTELLEIDR